MAILKVETDIIVSISTSPKGLGLWCLMPLSVIFHLYHGGHTDLSQVTDKLYHIMLYRKVESERISCDTSDNVHGFWDLQNWRYCFYWWHHIVFDVTLTNIFQYRIQFSDTDNITHRYQEKNVQMTNKIYYYMTINISFIWLAKNMRFFLDRTLWILSKPSISTTINLDRSRGAFGKLY